jgi:2-methylcitrate dehydratase PrpD
MNESIALARHVAKMGFDEIPHKAVDMAKKCFLDALGVTLAAGSLGEGCRQFVDIAVAGGGTQEATIIGFGLKVPAYMAAFANGSMAHSLDFEDAHDRAFVHPNTATVPAALAIAETLGGVSGKAFITATALGCDIVCRLGLAMTEDLLKYGWYMPPILSSFGGAAAAGKLLNLTVDQLLDAFSLVLCQATCSAELTNSPNSVVRSIREAFSAKAAVLSALLAKKGVAGFTEPIEGRAGFFRMYARDSYDLCKVTEGLGETFEGVNLSFKPWPSCRGTHSFIQAAMQIREEYGITPGDIRSVKVITSPFTKMLCEPLPRKQHPATAIDAKFSIPYTVATALVSGKVALDQFFPEALADPTVLEVAGKVFYEIDGSVTRDQESRGIVEISTDRGVLSRTVSLAYGHPENPLSDDKFVEKFRDCARYSAKEISDTTARELVQTIMHLEEVKDMREVARLL